MPPRIHSYRQHRTYKNPFQSRKGKRIPKRIKLDIFLFSSCVILWAYFLFFSPIFAIKATNIHIEEDLFNWTRSSGKDKLIKEQINNYFDSAGLLSLQKNNYFLFSEKKLQNDLSDFFFIKDVKVEKKFPNQLIIMVEKIRLHFILKLPYETLFLDKDGIVLEKHLISDPQEDSEDAVPKNTGLMPKINALSKEKSIPIITVNQDVEPNITDKIFSEELLSFINQFYVLFNEQRLGIDIESFEAKNIDHAQGTLKAQLKNMGYLYLNTSLTPEQQLENFITIYKDNIQPQNKQFEYIDLRFGDKIYIK